MTPTARPRTPVPNESNGTYQGGYTQGQTGAFDGAHQQGRRLQRQTTVRGVQPAVQQPEELHPRGVVQDHDQPAVARSSGSARADRHLRLLRPAHLHEQRRQGDLRGLDRLHQHHHHARRPQRRPVAPRGGQPEHHRGHEALRRRSPGRHQRPDRCPGLRRLLAGRWRQPLGLLQPVPRRPPSTRPRSTPRCSRREHRAAALRSWWRQRAQPGAGSGVHATPRRSCDLGQRIDLDRPGRHHRVVLVELG